MSISGGRACVKALKTKVVGQFGTDLLPPLQTGQTNVWAPGMITRLQASRREELTRMRQLHPESSGWRRWHDDETPVRLGLSSCLQGEAVRYDGGHSRDSFVVDTLGQWFEWVPVCPEMEIGMGVPRPTIRIEGDERATRLVSPSTGEDFTEQMARYAGRRVRQLSKSDLDGYILKKSSPSCGLGRIPVHGPKGGVRRNGVGFFASTLVKQWPMLPVEDEGRLNDAVARESFIEQIFCRNRWRVLKRRGLSRRRLVAFHTAHELLLLSHNQAGYRRMGKLIKGVGRVANRELFSAYERELHTAMAMRTTKKKHMSVLRHAVDRLKENLDSRDRKEIALAIADFGHGLLPLIVPLMLLRFHIRKYEATCLAGQIYFDPHPRERMLRNHV